RAAHVRAAEPAQLLGDRGNGLERRADPAEAELDPGRQGSYLRPLLHRQPHPPDCSSRERGNVLGRERPPERSLQRDDAGDCKRAPADEGPEMTAKIAIFGAGYAGLVTAACLAELGHDVVVRDVVPEKVASLRRGRAPFHEPGVDDLLERNAERLRFTLDARDAAENAEFLFVCVGTPATYAGDADLSAVWTVLDELPRTEGRWGRVVKSTLPVGTGEKVRAALDARGLDNVGYASNPEFLAEGSAVRDFLEPDRIVVGAFDEGDAEAVEALHEGIDAPIVRTDVPSAEM